MRNQCVIGWNSLRGISRKFLTFPPSAFSTTGETSRPRTTAARSVGGSMTLNLVTVSLWVTLRIATFRAERRSMPEEDRVVSGRGAFPTRKLLWVILRSTCTEIRERFSGSVFSSPITQYSGKVQAVEGTASSKSPPVDRARLHKVFARFREPFICLRDKLNPTQEFYPTRVRGRSEVIKRFYMLVFCDVNLRFDNSHDTALFILLNIIISD